MFSDLSKFKVNHGISNENITKDMRGSNLCTEIDFIDGEIVINKMAKIKSVDDHQKDYLSKLQEFNEMDCIHCIHYSNNYTCNHYEINIYDTTIQALDCAEFFNYKNYNK